MWSEEEQSFAGSIGDLVALAIASDQRRKLELKVQHAQKLESLGILAGGIAHDFNNLLVGILGNAGLALDEAPVGSRISEYVDDIRTSAKRAADLCHQLLAYSGKGKFVIGPMDLNELVREMGQLLEMSISKKTTLAYDLAPELPSIEADATQIRQIVMNLITNASESMGDAGGVVSIRTSTVACRREYLDHCYLGDHLPETTYVVLDVIDTGCGMDRETQHRIFDPFYRSGARR
jgi:signal transduction histidine kinase